MRTTAGALFMALALAWGACSDDDSSARVGEAHDSGSAGTAAAVDAGASHSGGNGGSAAGASGSHAKTDAGSPPVVCGGADLRHDPHNCGACGHDCLGTACKLGTCESAEVGEDVGEPLQIAIDAAAIYYATSAEIISQSRRGGTAGHLLVPPEFQKHSLRARSGWLYWLINESAQGNSWALHTMSNTGAGWTAVFEGVDEPISALAITDDFAVFLTTCASIWTVPLRFGGDPIEIAPLTCADSFATPLAIDPDGRYAYAIDSDVSDLWRVDLEASAAEDIVPQLYADELAVTSEHIYWINSYGEACVGDGRARVCDGGTIKRMGLEGGDPTLVVDSNFLAPMGYRFIRSLIADDHALYFELGPAGTTGSLIFSLPLDGSSTEPLIVGATVVAGEAPLALDDDYVYFVDQQRLMRVAK